MISTQDFISTIWEDYKSPTTSSFSSKIPQCRQTISNMDLNFEVDKTELIRLRKSVKGLHSSGNAHLQNEKLLATNLRQIGNTALSRKDSVVGDAFIKFANVAQDLSEIMQNMMQNINNIIMFPLECVTKSMKSDTRKSLEKASKEYDAKLYKVEKEKRQLAKDAGMNRTDISSAEIAEEMEKEKRLYQLQLTEYLLKVNEVKTKKGVELLQHLIEFNYIQADYFLNGQKIIDAFKAYVDNLMSSISDEKLTNENDRRNLQEVKVSLKSSVIVKEPQLSSMNNLSIPAYNIHQLQGNKDHGFQYNGHLLKKSDGKMRKVWQRRRCAIQHGYFMIYHSDAAKLPTKLNLLTCQIKLNVDDPGKKCFDMISSNPNRTYHFQAEDKKDFEIWISVINNAVEAVFLKETIGGEHTNRGRADSSLRDLVKVITDRVVCIPGNEICADCGAKDPDWLSVNLGILICMECCGVHRLMGVHISRTQSIVIDELNTSQLLLANVISNKVFNEILEANIEGHPKPVPDSDMETRKKFIRSKYELHRYAIVTCSSNEDRTDDLEQVVRQSDMSGLLQCYAEGADFLAPLNKAADYNTALHYAIGRSADFNLPLVDFMLQNSNSQNLDLCASDGTGDNVLHKCMKLVLRIRGDLINTRNNQNETALDIAQQCNHRVCIDVIESILAGNKEVCLNINIGWDHINEDRLYGDMLVEQSEDDELDNADTPRLRPLSLVEGDSVRRMVHSRERSLTADFATKGGTSSNSADLLSLSSMKKKGPAPLPPENYRNVYKKNGHSRNRSDGMILLQPSSCNTPTKQAIRNQDVIDASSLAGSKLVLPPPPKFRTHLKKSERYSDRFPNVNMNNSGTNALKPLQDTMRRFSLSNEIEISSLLKNRTFDKNAFDNKHKYSTLPKTPDANFTPIPGTASTPTPTPTTTHTTTGPTVARKWLKTRKLIGRELRSTIVGGPTTVPSLNDDDGSEGDPYYDLDDDLETEAEGGGGGISTVFPCTSLALYDCDADNFDELTFHAGDRIRVLRTVRYDDEWWYGYLEEDSEKRGVFPAIFVEVTK